MTESIVPMGNQKPESSRDRSPAHRCDEFQPGNPRRVALQQSSPPFPGQSHPATTTPARRDNFSERLTGTSQTVSLQGVAPLPSGDESAEVVHPGEEPFDFPTLLVAAELAP